jgi:HEAT repeat protein
MAVPSSLAIGCALLIAGFGLWQSFEAQGELQEVKAAFAVKHRVLDEEIDSLRAQQAALAATSTPLAARSPEVARPSVPVPQPLAGEAIPEPPRGRREQPVSPEILLAAFPGYDDREKERALDDLGDLAEQGDKAALGMILESLADENRRVREEAVEILGELSDPASLDALASLQADPSEDVREEVAEALGRMPAVNAGPVLAQMLSDGTSDVVEQALESIGRLQYRQALPQLLELMRGDDLEMTARSVRVLREMGETAAAEEALQRVIHGLSSNEALDRLQTVRYLRRVGGEDALAHLEQIAKSDASLSVREEARDALERMRDNGR